MVAFPSKAWMMTPLRVPEPLLDDQIKELVTGLL